jgi:cystathionine gamma-synthase
MAQDTPSDATPPQPHDGRVLSPATVAVHAGRPDRSPGAPFNEPVTFASTFVADGEIGYGREGNPTWLAFEEALGALEGGRAVSFASGLAAAAAVLDLVAQGATVVAPEKCYMGIIGQLADLESRGRLRSRLVDMTDTAAVLDLLDDDTALVWMESPANPTLEVTDIATIAAAAHEAGASVVVDNTFATPLLQKPLDLGADLVLHSATKFLAGHSDVLMGALVTRDERIFQVVHDRRHLTGAIPGPMESYLALRGLRTLPLRLERSQANAQELAGRLADHAAVSLVRYPGWGAMVSIELHGGAAAADRLTASTALWTNATSLGGVESTFERRRRWPSEPRTTPESLVRMSVGVEDVEDLWADLAQVLDRLEG